MSEAAANQVSSERAWPSALRALRHRNFRLFVGGQSISLIGTWMTRLATAWLVYQLTHSALLLGVVGFAGQILSFVFSPFAGVWIERMDRRRLLIVTQAVSALQSGLLALLVLTHRINMREIIGLSLLQGLINAFDMPGRQAFLVQMIDGREDLGNAVAINSSIVNAARLVGPALAGLVITYVGTGWCFGIDAVSYIAVIASLAMMNIVTVAQVRVAGATMLGQMREGWEYVRGFVPIRTVLLLFAALSLMGWPYATLLPVFAGQVLHGGAHTLAILTAASGCGALLGAVLLTLRKNVRGLTRVLRSAGLLFGGGLIGFGLSHALWLSIAMMLVVGYGMITSLAASNTLIQTLVPETMRGRVMSYYTMAFVGMAPFGSLLAGGLAHRFGAPMTVIVTGAVCLLSVGWYQTQLPAMREVLRPIYEGMGIMRSATEPALEDRVGASR